MPFVAKAIGPSGQVKWLTTPRLRDMRTFGPRESAEIFANYDEALAPINVMVVDEACGGLRFSIEQALPV
jgi:hypothetical protein